MKRLILLFVVAALVWGAATLWSAGSPPQSPPDPTWPELTPVAVDRVQFDAVESAGQDSGFALTIDRNAASGSGRWQAMPLSGNATFPALADKDKIVALLEFVSHNKPLRRLGTIAADKLADFGLDSPRMGITFSGKTEWTLSLGAANPSGDGIYAKSSLEPDVLLLGSKYGQLLERGETFYHDLRLLDFAVDNVKGVRLSGPGALGRGEWEAHLAKDADKGFAFTWPDRLLTRTVSQGELDLFLHTLATMKGASYLDAADGSGGINPDDLPQPYLSIELWLGKSATPVTVRVFDLAVIEPETPLETRFAVFTDWQTGPLVLDRERVSKLSRTAFSLMERKVVSMDMGKITRQRVVQKGHDGKPAQEIVAVRRDKGWATEGDSREMVGMDMLTWRLTDLKYEAEPVLILPESAQYALTWELYGDGENPMVELVFYLDPKLPEHLCWLKLWGEDRFYPVPDKLLEDLQGQLPLGRGASQPQ